MRYKYWAALGASILLGLIFVISGLGKLLERNAFLLNISASELLPSGFAAFIATWLPWVELILGVFLIIGLLSRLAALVCAALSGALIFYNSWMIAHGLGYEPCGCLGMFERVFKGNLSSINALYVDIGLLILALVIYFFYPTKLLKMQLRLPFVSRT